MSKKSAIQYDTASLKRQRPAIVKSRLAAFQKLALSSHTKATGLNENDPPELWRYVVGQRPATDLTENGDAKVLADYIGSIYPQFMGHPKKYQQFREELGKPTLRETIQSLAARVQEDAELAKHLSKLLDIYKQGPIPHEESEHAGPDKTTCWLIENWIEDPPSDKFLIKSLCFYSDLALAKLALFWRNGKTKWPLPDKVERETSRIKKLYARLGLVPARPRAIRDVNIQRDQLHFIPHKKAVYRGH